MQPVVVLPEAVEDFVLLDDRSADYQLPLFMTSGLHLKSQHILLLIHHSIQD
jgi:hypothetical protein